jgi:hypothetical protein
MFSLLRNRFGIPGVISVIALVFAITGGAWAAKGVIITKLSQIKPSVQNQLKGKAGPAGPAGLPGPAGAKGDPGAKGGQGNPGTDGTSVTATDIPVGEAECAERGGVLVEEQGSPPGTEICNGEDGSPWVAGTVPTGTVLRGVWAIQPYTAAAADENILVPISTVVPIKEKSELGIGVLPIFKIQGTEEPSVPGGPHCPGNAGTPTAPTTPGFLCVYAEFNPQTINLKGPSFGGAGESGGGVVAKPKAVAPGLVQGNGVWVMRAP